MSNSYIYIYFFIVYNCMCTACSKHTNDAIIATNERNDIQIIKFFIQHNLHNL